MCRPGGGCSGRGCSGDDDHPATVRRLTERWRGPGRSGTEAPRGLALTNRTKLAVIAIGFVASGVIASARPAAAQTTAPILRVETGMHTTLIRRVVVDAERHRLITASDDKTIRVWQMPEARLLNVLRVPMDTGHEGQLFGLAVSPDGTMVAAGGWTAWDWEGKGSIYVFDVATGDLVRRLGGLDETISALVWSRDGRDLLVGLQGRGVFVVLRADTGAVVARDAQYLDKLQDIDISPQGRVVAVALDGMVRLYAPDYRLIGRRAVPGGTKPISVKYAPDGESFAVGFIDKPNIAVLSGRDLTPLYQPITANLVDQVNFSSVVWSSDGRFIYGGGDYRGAGLNPLYRWPDAGRGQPERIPLMRNRITEIQQMPDGDIAFAAEDPGLGIVAPNGKVIAYRGPDIVNFSADRAGLLVSADGAVISYPVSPDGRVRHAFDVLGGGDQVPATPPTATVFPPRRSAPGMAVLNWKDQYAPTINGKTPTSLDDYETARSYAITPDGKRVLLGTEWAIRLFDAGAQEIWSRSLPAVAWSVNVSRNADIAVAALSDGTIRWYRMADGQEILAYFPHVNGTDWMAWVPDGYYTSSVYGDNYVGWHLNRGKDLAPDFYRAVQFDRILYRPDVVAGAFRQALAAATGSAAPPTPNDALFKIAQLRSIAPPRLRVLAGPPEGLADGRPRVRLTLEGEKNALPIKDYTVFVNGIPVTPSGDRPLSGSDATRFERTVEVDLSAKANEIRVEAFNGVSMGIEETYIGLPTDVPPSAIRGNLYVLAVGVDSFPDLPPNLNLAFAAQDADAMAATLKQEGAGYYTHVFLKVLSDNQPVKPDRDAILSALDFVKQAGALDTVLIFLASHGITDPKGNYYFVPRDVAREDVIAVQRGETGASLVSWQAFFDALRGAAGRRILIVDSCHAGRAQGTFDSHSLLKRSASSMFPLVVASKGDETSQEYAPARHGLFTYALMNAFVAAADTNGDHVVSLQEAFKFAIPIVEKLRSRDAGAQTPQMLVPPILGNVGLLAVDR
jgi:WD40 repeat protein